MRRAAVLLVAASVAACSRGPSDDGAGRGNLLTPGFLPEAATASTTTTTSDRVEGMGEDRSDIMTTTVGAGSAPARTPAEVEPPAVPGATTAAIVDRQGDLTPSLDPPPPWADLLGSTLVRRADGFELRVRLGGGSAPTMTDRDHTMNVASFYDVDGDGGIDYEVWANLASGGWGGSWFDNVGKKARYGDRSNVAIEVVGDEVVLRFPLSHVGGAERFRWSLASEWGRYKTLGTPATARDDLPDNDDPAHFPG
jgi:hypothetical protein